MWSSPAPPALFDDVRAVAFGGPAGRPVPSET